VADKLKTCSHTLLPAGSLRSYEIGIVVINIGKQQFAKRALKHFCPSPSIHPSHNNKVSCSHGVGPSCYGPLLLYIQKCM